MREINRRGLFRYNFLTNRVVENWNQLSQDAVNAKTVNVFKSIIDKEVFGRVQRNDCYGSSRAKRHQALV